MLLLLCAVFFSAIQYGEEIELTILRSFFILSVIQNYNRTVKVFLNTIRKEVGGRGGGGLIHGVQLRLVLQAGLLTFEPCFHH